jgi:eukaryotic-like serine/threonine-protein kinase
MTQMGVIMGTAAYMSPEQAKGREADKRSDVWAFGAVLYEMLTARRAFEGEDISDTLASVLKSEPEWSHLPPDVPFAIRLLIQRCLTKDRRQRVADISAAKFVLNEMGHAGETRAQAGGSAPVVDTRRRILISALAASVATAIPRPGLLLGDLRGYDVLPDGRVISTTASDLTNAALRPEAHVVLNWFEELKRLAPSK